MIIALLAALFSAIDRPVETLPTVHVNRYLAVWHEVARLPDGFQEAWAGAITGRTRSGPAVVRA